MANNKIIKKGRVTEKSTDMTAKNIYTFNVDTSANKKEVEKAIFALYKVKPVKVNILKVPSKVVVSKGRKGVKSGGKKAVVYLKKEDKIELV